MNHLELTLDKLLFLESMIKDVCGFLVILVLFLQPSGHLQHLFLFHLVCFPAGANGRNSSGLFQNKDSWIDRLFCSPSLCEKCPNTEFFLVRIQENTCVSTLFYHCFKVFYHSNVVSWPVAKLPRGWSSSHKFVPMW